MIHGTMNNEIHINSFSTAPRYPSFLIAGTFSKNSDPTIPKLNIFTPSSSASRDQKLQPFTDIHEGYTED
jgi:hypothetical protein